MSDIDYVAGLIRDIPDFPEPGVVFKDIMPLLRDARGYRMAIDQMLSTIPTGIDVVVGMEARGFLFAAPIARELQVGLVPVRKPGKLPGDVVSQTYDLEYGSNTLSISAGAINPGDSVLIVDDVLATGGTVAATAALVQQLGGQTVQVNVLVELSFLHGRSKLMQEGITQIHSQIVV